MAKQKEDKRVAITAAPEDADPCVRELSVASARDRWLEAAVVSGQVDLDKLSLRCAEQEFESCMYAERIDQIRGRIEVMKESEAEFQTRARELKAALAALRVEEAAFCGTPDVAYKTLYVECAECVKCRILVVSSLLSLSLQLEASGRVRCNSRKRVWNASNHDPFSPAPTCR